MRGVPPRRRAMGAPAPVHGMWSRRLLRQFTQPPRNGPLACAFRASACPFLRTGRGLVVVLRRPAGLRAGRRPARAQPPPLIHGSAHRVGRVEASDATPGTPHERRHASAIWRWLRGSDDLVRSPCSGAGRWPLGVDVRKRPAPSGRLRSARRRLVADRRFPPSWDMMSSCWAPSPSNAPGGRGGGGEAGRGGGGEEQMLALRAFVGESDTPPVRVVEHHAVQRIERMPPSLTLSPG